MNKLTFVLYFNYCIVSCVINLKNNRYYCLNSEIVGPSSKSVGQTKIDRYSALFQGELRTDDGPFLTQKYLSREPIVQFVQYYVVYYIYIYI